MDISSNPNQSMGYSNSGLSPVVFDYATDWIIILILSNLHGIRVIHDSKVIDLEFTGVSVTLCYRTVLEARFVGLEVNTSKIKMFRTSHPHQ